MTTPTDEGIRLAEGMYEYTLDDRPRAKEMWRLTRLFDNRLHMQTLMGTGSEFFFGMDLTMDANGTVESLQVRLNGNQGEQQASFSFDDRKISGTISGPKGNNPVELELPPHTLIVPESIATRFLIGQIIDWTTDEEQVMSICLVPILSPHYPPLQPVLFNAHMTVLGNEAVDLLMATVTANHVLLEWPGYPPQHAWFDEHHFPVQWYWVRQEDNKMVAHNYALTRYTWASEH
jgi:hypothetical protein